MMGAMSRNSFASWQFRYITDIGIMYVEQDTEIGV